ncbi:LPS export ABC transporter ATP-binding protein [Candidatus Cyanaurora vandensis]|uniref:LPS export ABC transporter ATP-binding protein n=1 Tax=Candidatus Cyanaurora vandensis TaxID=2714958 RepID=UPI002580DD05|nr:LPS export ABC transporter ATP-binding protein [Candidatus Cyanaurora vandensis]
MKLSVENLRKSYGKRLIVKDITLQLEQGEVVGLLGGNGAGKTTTFYVICGLERPDHGQVCLDQRDITTVPMNERSRLGIAYLAQEHSVFRKLSVEDNLLLVMEQTGVPPALWQVRSQALLTEFNLHPVRKSLGLQLSGGEKRRVEIARALAAGKEDPHFLLLDEPFAGVDPITVNEIQQMLARLKTRGIGILITDHNVAATLAITDRAYILHDGYILAEGNPAQLAENPQVREFYLGENFRL